MDCFSRLKHKFALRYAPKLLIGILIGFIAMGVIEIPKVSLSQTYKIVAVVIVLGIVLWDYVYSAYKKKKSPGSYSQGTGWLPTGLLISSLLAIVLPLENGTIAIFWFAVSVVCLVVQLSAE